MRITEERLPRNIENLLLHQKGFSPSLFYYAKDGIYITKGAFKGSNLTNLYKENPDEVEDFLINLGENGCSSLIIKRAIKNVIQDLKNNY